MARDGVTANVILPGRIATRHIRFIDEFKAKRENRLVDAVTAESTGSIPLGPFGEPKKFGAVVAFLASRQTSYVANTVQQVYGSLLANV